MQKHCSVLLVFLLGISALVSAQFTVTGRVLDSVTREPLNPASVFCQNTTLGTTTNKEGEFVLQLKSGGYDLVFTYTGYQTQTIRITGDVNKFEILMVKEEKNLGEVVITASNEVKDGWEKHGKQFTDMFIGATPFAEKCTIQNPDAVKFYYYKRTDKLKVLATEPLIISNDALGYDLHYRLDSFVYYFKTEISSYRGTCFYTEKLGTVNQAMAWKANREKAYAGSRMHFMRSVYDSTVKQSGFTVSILDENDKTKFALLTSPLSNKYYSLIDSLDEVELFYPQKISVTYTKAVPENEYLKQFGLPMDVGVQISYIDIMNPIAIKLNGYFYDQKDWINQGYWSWKNLADQLPYDYVAQ
ncbi:MAG TPA: carboxypeptidase-like regulatory domain-containing protein [Chitinophagaceae bacterium]